MAYGLRVRDGSTGAITLDVTDRITRFGGAFDTGTADGSVSIPMLSGGTPWFHVQDSDPFSGTSDSPNVTISGNAISWAFPAGSTYAKRSVHVLYGVY